MILGFKCKYCGFLAVTVKVDAVVKDDYIIMPHFGARNGKCEMCGMASTFSYEVVEKRVLNIFNKQRANMNFENRDQVDALRYLISNRPIGRCITIPIIREATMSTKKDGFNLTVFDLVEGKEYKSNKTHSSQRRHENRLQSKINSSWHDVKSYPGEKFAEIKAKETVELFRYTYKAGTAIRQTNSWNNGSWEEQAHPDWTLVKTESKIVEYDA